jgi:5-methyltetrahydropteroyltriglutamate--homocysteine methyltransferase
MTGVPRSDVVGSLLRPPELLKARRDHEAGRLTDEQLRAIEDRAIRGAIRLQEEVGLAVLTDGEYRRSAYYGGFTERVEGFRPDVLEREFTGADGKVLARLPAVAGPLRRVRSIAGHELTFLRSEHRGPAIPKVTLPSANLMARYWKPGLSETAYPNPENYVVEVAAILRDEITDLVARGASYLQIDAPQYTFLADERMRDQIVRAGGNVQATLERMIATDNQTRAGGATEVMFGVHLCRGNFRGHWLASGGYDPIAEQLFNDLAFDRFLLEYDSARAGDFAPLRFVPPGKIVVLGLVTTKSAEVESVDALCQRVEEAARYLPLDQLAISPQCGFASDSAGNPLDEDAQRRKLEAIVATARRVWAA